MNYGNWEKAILRSVVSGYILLGIWLFSSQIIDGYIFNAAEQFLVIGIGSVTYWGLSICGWVIIGIPVHFSLCKWANPEWRFYLYICSIVILLIWAIYGLFSALFFGAAILFQAGVFRYYVFKTKT
ncbi:hypothetical protein [Sessilibacter sp. MAH2]